MARHSSDIDPHSLSVPDEKPRRPVRLDRPAPLPSVKDAEAASLARQKKRAASPGVMIEPHGETGYRIASPHNDEDLWWLQIADALGTRSTSVIHTFMRDLKRLTSHHWDEDAQRLKPDETELNAALAMIADIRPRNAMEAALAAQMVAVHWMQMRMSRDALNRGGMIMEKDAAIASKLARTFTMQIEALRGMKRRKQSVKQTITVRKETHQHVHYHHDRGAGDNHVQPHGRIAEAADERPPLRSQEPRGQVVSLPRRQG